VFVGGNAVEPVLLDGPIDAAQHEVERTVLERLLDVRHAFIDQFLRPYAAHFVRSGSTTHQYMKVNLDGVPLHREVPAGQSSSAPPPSIAHLPLRLDPRRQSPVVVGRDRRTAPVMRRVNAVQVSTEDANGGGIVVRNVARPC